MIKPRQLGKAAALSVPTKKPTRLSSDRLPHEYGRIKKYDVIIVGAGPAGATAAYFMARQGMDVLLLERGTYPGAKSYGGSTILAEHIHALFPNFWEELPWERLVIDQSYWWMTEDSTISLRFQSERLAAAPYNRFSVTRPNLYRWLVDKAVAAGAVLLLEHHVSEVMFEGQQAVGVKVSPPQDRYFAADLVILADGANSLLAERAGLAPRVSPQSMSLYVTETITLGRAVINERFQLSGGNGTVIGLIGYPTAGFNGTGSIHTYKDSVSINAGMPVSYFAQSGIRPHDLLIRIKRHPFIQPLIVGGTTTEYGGAMIPEGGYYAIPRLVHPGVLMIGDAGSLVNGVHGINLAMWSGFFAAQAAFEAKKYRDFSPERLSLYKKLLDDSFVMQDLQANAGAAKLQEEVPYLFDLYTKMANEAAYTATRAHNMPKWAKRVWIIQKMLGMQPLGKMLLDAWKVFKVVK